MKFQTRVYHPNISPQGHICADFGNKWNTFHDEKRYNTNVTSMWYRGKSSTPQWTLGALLTAICGLLARPDVDDPLVPEIAQLYLEDYDAYCENARIYTTRYATSGRPDESSLSFLEEDGDPVESVKASTDSDGTAVSQSEPAPRHVDDKENMREIRDYDDQYPGSLILDKISPRDSTETYATTVSSLASKEDFELSGYSIPLWWLKTLTSTVLEIQVMKYHRMCLGHPRVWSHERVGPKTLRNSSLTKEDFLSATIRPHATAV